MEPVVKKILVTPAMAEAWLLKNTNNRALNERLVNEYVYQMRKNKWRLTTDAIGFDETGRLINGQHRLTAIARTGKSVELMVATGLKPEAFNVIDVGRMRTAGDLLNVNEISSGTKKAAIARNVMLYKKGRIFSSLSDPGSRSSNITNEEVLEFSLKNMNQLDEAHDIALKVYRSFKAIHYRHIGMMFWIFAELDKPLAMAFFELYSTGAGLSKDHSIYMLRQKLINDMAANRKMQVKEKIHYLIQAWNHFRRGKKVKHLRYETDANLPVPV